MSKVFGNIGLKSAYTVNHGLISGWKIQSDAKILRGFADAE